MQLVGIGFASSNWNTLVKQLQKQVSHQLNEKLFVDSVSVAEPEISSKELEYASAELKKLKADWVLFSPGAFENPQVCLKLLEELKIVSEKNIREVTMFPMNQNAQDLMMNAPSSASEEQLKELKLSIKKKS